MYSNGVKFNLIYLFANNLRIENNKMQLGGASVMRTQHWQPIKESGDEPNEEKRK